MDTKTYNHNNSRGENSCKKIKKPCPAKKKVDFKKIKKNTINSLNEVECFLHDFKKLCKYIKLYKILK